MRKAIKKMSVVTLPTYVGSISDTYNVQDKIHNAPSIRLAQALNWLPKDSVIMYDGDVIPEGYTEISTGGFDGAAVSYDPTGTGLDSTNVQDAITELAQSSSMDWTPVKLYSQADWTHSSQGHTSGNLSESYKNFLFIYIECRSIQAGLETQTQLILSSSIDPNWGIQCNFSMANVSRRVFCVFPTETTWKWGISGAEDNLDYNVRRIYGIGRING